MKFTLPLFRTVGLLEGISYLVLLIVAMPLKYLADMPLAVTIVGGMHGGLFVAYVALATLMALVYRWPMGRLAYALLASILPTGPFWFDRHLQRLQLPPAPPPK